MMSKIFHNSFLKILPISIIFWNFTYCKPNQNTFRFKPVINKSYKIETEGDVDPISSTQSKKGGVYTTWGGPYPKSLNYWLDNWSTSGQIMGLLFEPLIGMHSTKNKPVGILAKSWKKNADKKTFIFKIHPESYWSDGKPLTAVDIQFYYDTIMNKDHRTTPSRVLLSRFERPKILNAKTIQIRTKKRHWKAFWDAGAFMAFPKHIWEGKNFNRINFEFPVISGPYRIQDIKRNRYVLLRRRASWWGRIRKYNQHKYNFDYIRYRFMEDRTAALEIFKTNKIDVYPIYTSSLWVQQTNFTSVQKNWVLRQEIYNKEPKSFQGFAINLRREKFQDIRVRKALCHLLDRKLMNEKLMFNQYFLLNSYFPDLYANNINPKVPLCKYDPVKARLLLDRAGWIIGNQGIRKKKGESLTLSFLTSSTDLRHTNIYVEALKKSGIEASIEQLSHATITEKVDNFQFDLFWINVSGSRLRDPESLFHSKYTKEIASSNITGLKDIQVDTLLEKLKTEEHLDRRNILLRKLDYRLVALAPYILLWQSDKTRLLYWNRFGTPTYVLDKYNRENSIVSYWWVDANRNKQLEEARNLEKSLSLPSNPKTKYPNKIIYKGP